jgi:tetrahydromethanopterin S-methyltransferase subunit B
MASSLLRYPRRTSLIVFAGVTRAVEYGFIAAGVTVAVVALIQSFSVVAGWIHLS